MPSGDLYQTIKSTITVRGSRASVTTHARTVDDGRARVVPRKWLFILEAVLVPEV